MAMKTNKRQATVAKLKQNLYVEMGKVDGGILMALPTARVWVVVRNDGSLVQV